MVVARGSLILCLLRQRDRGSDLARLFPVAFNTVNSLTWDPHGVDGCDVFILIGLSHVSDQDCETLRTDTDPGNPTV